MRLMAPLIQSYKENVQRAGTYDLIQSNDQIGIKYFVIKPPRNDRFRIQEAELILESWTNGEKQLFTGLIKLPKTDNVFFGNLLTGKDKKSFICLIKTQELMQIHCFKSFCPSSKRSQISLLWDYFEIRKLIGHK